jgi:signal recognition particle receptor subunit beta
MQPTKIYVVGQFNTGKSTFVCTLGGRDQKKYEYEWVDTKETFGIAGPIPNLHSQLEFASVVLDDGTPIHVFSHPSTASYRKIFTLIGHDIAGIVYLVNSEILLTHSKWGPGQLQSSRDDLDFIRAVMPGRYVIAATKVDVLEFASSEAVSYLCGLLSLRDDEVLIPCVNSQTDTHVVLENLLKIIA